MLQIKIFQKPMDTYLAISWNLRFSGTYAKEQQCRNVSAAEMLCCFPGTLSFCQGSLKVVKYFSVLRYIKKVTVKT